MGAEKKMNGTSGWRRRGCASAPWAPSERHGRLGVFDIQAQAGGVEHFAHKQPVVLVVFQVQDAHRRRWVGRLLPQVFPLAAPGGGSLMTAQKNPSCLMDSTNFWQSTGLQT